MIDDFVRRTKCSEIREKNITDRVSQLIVQDLRPIRIVECEGFRSLLSYLQPGYTLPSCFRERHKPQIRDMQR